MGASAPKPTARNNGERRRAAAIGAAVLVILMLMFAAVIFLHSRQGRQDAADYRQARAVLARYATGKLQPCGAPLEQSRQVIRRQIKRGRLREGLINKKAIVYDHVLLQAQTACAGEAVIVPPEGTPCTSLVECRDAAVGRILTGRYPAALQSCRQGLEKKEDGSMRVLKALVEDLISQNANHTEYQP